ncbi:DUF748 domain-containing protein [Pseudocolwellia sp. HL-MZ19]|uniref:DUF748 domain-containing protein n=1 Tax=Pseudocolwellia sp. HL-MZ19 TaxID=3400846 RepID=UPI003CEB2344
MPSPALPFYKRLLFIIAAFIFILYCLIWVLSSPIIKYFAKDPLAEYGLTLSEDAYISYNPFLTRIDINDLVLLKDNEAVFKTDELALQIALHKVPFKVIELEEFMIDGVFVKIDKQQNDLFVAGVNLTPEKAEANEEELTAEASTNESTEEASTEPSAFEVQLENLILSNTVIAALVDGNAHQFDIKKLLISHIKASQTQQSASLELTSLLDDAAINITSQLNLENNEGSIKSTIDVSEYSLNKINHLIQPIETLSGLLSFSSTPNIQITNNSINVEIENTKLATENIIVDTQEQHINYDSLVYTVSDIALSMSTTDETQGSASKITAKINNTQLTANNLKANTKEQNIALDDFVYSMDNIDVKLDKGQLNSKQPQAIAANKINATVQTTQLSTKNLKANTKEQSVNLDDFSYKMDDVSVSIDQSELNSDQPQATAASKINAVVKATQLSTKNLSANTKEQRVNLSNLLYNIEGLSVDISQGEFTSAEALPKSEIEVTVENTELTTKDVAAYTQKQRIHLENLLYSMAGFSINMGKDEQQKDQITSIDAKAQFVLTKASVEALPEATTDNNETDHSNLPKILFFEELNLSNISPKLAENPTGNIEADLSVLVDSLNIKQLLLSQTNATELPPVATINNISITDINGSAVALSLNEINIDTIKGDIILNKEKVLANLVNIASEDKVVVKEQEVPQVKVEEKTTKVAKNSNKKAKKSKKTKKSELPVEPPIEAVSTKAPFYISLNAINVINTNQINFIDNSVNPIYKRSFTIDELSVGKLSNIKENANNKTPILLKGRSNRYANFAFEGFIQPFAAKQTYHLKGSLNELSLPDVSTYMKDALKLVLKSGQLNTKLDITLINDDIDGDVNIKINGLETAAANDEVNAVKDQVGIPFNVALGMLKDGNGDLVLDVPLSGKTSSPSFGISSFIALITKKAVMSATQDYLMTTFVPYANIVSVAMTAGEFILKLRFEDLPYDPQQVELDEKQQIYIQQFAALMKDRKDTRVKVCAISVPGDIGLPVGQKLTPEEIKTLKEMGDQREQAFKDHVVEQAQIESGRILLCTPQIDSSKGAIPRMVISV